jgi:heme/copper-type cytochrome/quinol oxidase subunit 4
MGYIKELTSPDGLRGMFNIFLTATILTIFEIVFFYKIVVPGVENSMNNGINKISVVLADNINATKKETMNNATEQNKLLISNIFTTIKNSDNAFFKTFASREKLLTVKINKYTKITGVIIIMILVLLLCFIYYSLKSQGDVELYAPILTSFLTVCALISFQIMFYFFSLKYNYPGSEGNDELLYTMIQGIKV